MDQRFSYQYFKTLLHKIKFTKICLDEDYQIHSTNRIRDKNPEKGRGISHNKEELVFATFVWPNMTKILIWVKYHFNSTPCLYKSFSVYSNLFQQTDGHVWLFYCCRSRGNKEWSMRDLLLWIYRSSRLFALILNI